MYINSAIEINSYITEHIEKCNTMSFAVAWASIGFSAHEALTKYHRKVSNAVVGLHFYQTHPEFILEFNDNEAFKFELTSDGIFHPKIYIFNYDSYSEMLVGSANFTSGGLVNNIEACLVTRSKDDIERASNDIIRWGKSLDKLTREYIINYTKIYRSKMKLLNRVCDKYGDENSAKDDNHYLDGGLPIVSIKAMSMSWDEYYKMLRKEKLRGENNIIKYRIQVLESINKIFVKFKSLSKMSYDNRRKVCGLVNDALDGTNYLWFGSMKGAGYYNSVVKNNDKELSDALDVIPLYGAITENMYNEFIEKFTKSIGTGSGIATATRLLAMKRPDFFVCLDGKNRKAMCENFEIRQTVDYSKYWGSIILRIQDSVWYNSDKPKDKFEFKVWNNRVAMLDGIYYIDK